MKTYGKMLRKLRENAGYTIGQVVHLFGECGCEIPNSRISRWENGYSNPSLEDFILLCALYGIPEVHEAFEEGNLPLETPTLNKKGYEKLLEHRDLLLLHDEYRVPKPEDLEKPAESRELPPHLIIMLRMAKEKRKRADGTEEEVEHAVPIVISPQDKEKEIPVYVLGPHRPNRDAIATQNFEIRYLPESKTKDAHFAVVVHGDSNVPMLAEGTLVFIRRTQQFGDRDVALVTVEGHTFLRQLRYTPDGIWLVAANPAYRPIFVESEKEFTMHGLVVGPVLNTGLIQFRPEDEVKPDAVAGEAADDAEGRPEEANDTQEESGQKASANRASRGSDNEPAEQAKGRRPSKGRKKASSEKEKA